MPMHRRCRVAIPPPSLPRQAYLTRHFHNSGLAPHQQLTSVFIILQATSNRLLDAEAIWPLPSPDTTWLLFGLLLRVSCLFA
ncbi:uncharacterized protein BDZ83DRAFT_610375 [Colletotrichum acutatum]|uniref:Uncharacterized protein n=1 Tax=Glomerella acutata TaxID=27357 RepID=A0AAD8UXD2_GLOAC|nr:uncharacterized protein BDZ83DRAFT_610375 [Colletotrichum acutatum]KAK1728140.1 hypothetical protein BDZ83DRAFT_610375 [Colletotrichum acutatum]